MIHKTDAEGYSKNLDTGVVVNKNNNDYMNFIQTRERIKREREIQNDIAWLKKECAEIREIIKNFCEKN